MTIGELRQLITGLPDDYQVKVGWATLNAFGEPVVQSWSTRGEIEVQPDTAYRHGGQVAVGIILVGVRP
jgi:hypothetical protein